MKKINLYASSATGNKLVLCPLEDANNSEPAYIVEVNNKNILLDMYCKNHTLEILDDKKCLIIFDGLELNFNYIKTKNTLSNIMDMCKKSY
jgi:hypothetical protein